MSQGAHSAARSRPLAAGPGGVRLLLMSALGALIGLAAGVTAYILYGLIAVITNGVYFHHLAFKLPNITHNTLGGWVLIVPAIGGLIVGIMARYGSNKIRGHGIPEAMEAIVVNKAASHRGWRS